MSCKICSIINGKLRQAIEDALIQFDGTIPASIKNKLCEEFPEHNDALENINAHDCEVHFNFHQAIGRSVCKLATSSNTGAEETHQSSSLAGDVGKDEAEILLELLNTQYATFTAITNKINGAIKRAKVDELTGLLINPGTAQFYKELGDSVRATVRELRELNTAVNGKQDGALEGLKALAGALSANRTSAVAAVAAPVDDMTTTMFDD